MKWAITFFVVLFSANLLAQVQATTKEGKKVLLYNDGTWKYLQEDQNIRPFVSVCDSLVEQVTDKVNGQSYIGTKKSVIVTKDDKNGFLIRAMKTDISLILSFKLVGQVSCIEKETQINILFRDGTRLEFYADNDFTCDKSVVVYFRDTQVKKKILQELKTKEIEILRIWTSKGYKEEEFTKENSVHLKSILNCL